MTSSPASARFLGSGPASHVLSAVPDFAIAALFATAWLHPDLLPPDKIRLLLVSMLLEFIVVHSGGMMGALYAGGRDPAHGRSTMFIMVTLAFFYSIFAGAFSLAFHTWWPFASFWGLMLNRMVIVLLDPRPAPEKSRLVMTNWGLTTMSYLGWVFATCIVSVPRMGFTNDIVTSLHLEGGGLWIDEPWRVMALGAGYYATIGLIEVFVLSRMAGARVESAEGLSRPA